MLFTCNPYLLPLATTNIVLVRDVLWQKAIVLDKKVGGEKDNGQERRPSGHNQKPKNTIPSYFGFVSSPRFVEKTRGVPLFAFGCFETDPIAPNHEPGWILLPTSPMIEMVFHGELHFASRRLPRKQIVEGMRERDLPETYHVLPVFRFDAETHYGS